MPGSSPTKNSINSQYLQKDRLTDIGIIIRQPVKENIMSIILEKRENQYGEEIAVSTIFFEDGKWFWETINCESSHDLGFGTCRCVSHDPMTIHRISREMVKSQLGERICELTDEERENLLDESLKIRIQEVFDLLGFNREQVETWALDCYRLGMNPLPILRKHLEGICEVGFMYDSPGTGWACEKPMLICKLSQNNDGIAESVCLEVVNP